MKEKREPNKTRLIKSPHLRIRKNIEKPIDDIIAEQGLIAQEFIENEVEGWQQVPLCLTDVYYRRVYDESLILLDFHPKNKQHQVHPNVLALFRRTGRNKGDEIAEIEEFYIPYDDEQGSIPMIYERFEGRKEGHYLDEEGTLGFDKYHEVMGLITEVENIV